MPGLQIEQAQHLQMRQELKQMLRIEQANLLKMSEDEFNRLVADIEQSPLFKKLYQKGKLIRYCRFSRTDISSSFYQLKEDLVADKGSLNLESLSLDKEHIICQIKKLGSEKFKRYFLFAESGITLKEIARECELDISEVQKINSLIDDFSIMSEFYHPSNVTSDSIHYSKVASVEKDAKGFVIGYFSATSARGRYSIDYERLEELTTAGMLSKAEVKETRQLFKKLELINNRKDTLSQILQNIIDKQALYLESGDTKSLLPFSQKELARRIGFSPSSVSRAIRNKSIDTPWGQEIPLKHLFPRPKRFKKELLRQLLETNNCFSSDEAIRAKLQEEFGVTISRRSVTNLRRELKFPAAKEKRHFVGISEER